MEDIKNFQTPEERKNYQNEIEGNFNGESETEFRLIITGQICPYCRKPSEYVNSNIIYGRSYGMMYYCHQCDAYVGTHKNGMTALGRLANKELRQWKKEAHKYFDMTWKGYGEMERSNAYKWLSNQMKLPTEFTHIGMFDIAQCKMVVEISKSFLNNIERLNDKTPFPIFE